MKRYYFIVLRITVLAAILIVLSSDFSFAEDISTQKKEHYKVGIGFGIPYGIIGGNLEVAPIDYIALSAGLGIAPGGGAYSIGGRIYPLGKGKNFRPRLSAMHGVVAFLEKRYLFGDSEFENKTGTAYGIGFEWKLEGRNRSVDFDIIIPKFNIPEGYEEYGPPVKISIGYGWLF